MLHRFSREELLIGQEGLEKLQKVRVAVFGIGGVGGHVVEALARSGVGALDLFDGDRVSLTNINRQIIALNSTVGQLKVEAAKERVLDINPDCRVEAREMFFTPENAGEVDFSQYDYVADAIDTVTSKIELIHLCREAGVPVISSMGAGNKLDPTAFRVDKIEKTSVCPLARVMRRELKKRGITGVKAVYSTEESLTPAQAQSGDEKGTAGRPTPGSMAFVPSVAGLILAGEIIKDLLEG
jgi:tRNA A37 threonylcarbamoyladenosine dehydratase